jgi:hypothetical protein
MDNIVTSTYYAYYTYLLFLNVYHRLSEVFLKGDRWFPSEVSILRFRLILVVNSLLNDMYSMIYQ